MKDKIAAWKHAFEVDDQAVLPTLVNFAWNFAAFSTVVELVRRTSSDEAGRMRLNGMVMDLFAESYWGSTVLTIRRLVDKGPVQGPKGVCSLRAIVDDARASRTALTRRVYLEEVAGLPFDYEALREKYWDYVMSQPPGRVDVPREYEFDSSEQRHIEFDWLSGTTEASRSERDLIQIEVFDRLDARLAQVDDIAVHATVHFAHAATEASRQGRVLERWGPEEAKHAIKILTQTAELVGRWFCFSSVGDILPMAQYDQFEFLDAPLLHGPVEPLQEHWVAFADEVASWPQIDNDEL